MKKELEFQDVRTETNTRHNAVISALRTVQHVSKCAVSEPKILAVLIINELTETFL